MTLGESTMGNRAFLIAGGRAAVIANDDRDFRYSATAHYVPVGVQAPARCHERAETQFLVEDGVMEFMISCLRIFVRFCQASSSFCCSSEWMF